MNTIERVRIRAPRQTDLGFVTSNWLKSNKESTKGIPNSVYFRNMQLLLEVLIPNSHVRILCDRYEDDFIYGFICAEVDDGNIPIIHYAYVRRKYRQQGLGKMLLEDFYKSYPNLHRKLGFYTHRTDYMDMQDCLSDLHVDADRGVSKSCKACKGRRTVYPRTPLWKSLEGSLGLRYNPFIAWERFNERRL